MGEGRNEDVRGGGQQKPQREGSRGKIVIYSIAHLPLSHAIS